MKKRTLLRLLFAGLLLAAFFTYGGCKKQAKCGCGRDVIQTLTDLEITVQYNESSNSIIFYPVYSNGATYYFCNPAQWIDSIKKMNTQSYLLLTGKAYYDCNYMMQVSNYPYIPPVYQVEVSSVREDNYGK